MNPAPNTPESPPVSFSESAALLVGISRNRARPFRAAPGSDGRIEAARSVAIALGCKSPAKDARGDSPDERFANYLYQAGLRQRKASLEEGWFRRDAGPLIAFFRAGGNAVALLPHKGKSYLLLDPHSGNTSTVTKEIAAEISHHALMLYRPFPGGPVNAGTLLQHALHGQYGQLAIVFAVGFLAALLSLLVPLMTQLIVGDIIPQAERSQLGQIVLGMLAAAAAMCVFRVTGAFAILRVEGRGAHAAQTGCWDRLLHLPATFFRTTTAGDLANRVDGVNAIRSALSTAAVSYILGAIFSAVNLALIFYYNWKLAFVALLLVFSIGACDIFVSLANLRFLRRSMTMNGRVTGRLFQIISGVAKWKIAAAEERALGRWAELFVEKKIADKWSGYIRGFGSGLKTAFPIFTTLVNFGVFYFFLNSELSTGEFLGYNAAFTQLLSSMLAATNATGSLIAIVPLYERIQPILQAETERSYEGASPGNLSGKIEVRNVGFRYSHDGPDILRNVNFSVEPGEFVALVGTTGSGKSTLLRLLLGFDKPSIGSILYDDKDLRNLDNLAVRRQLGVVLQGDRILAGDIFHNIAGSHPKTEEEVWQAAEEAGIREEIEKLPMGLRTFVAENGTTFSGGQLQRLIIARALVNRPSILFFDEATSALDNVSQAVVSENIRKRKVTRIVIAQRLSTIRHADRILVLHEGTIAESGSFEQLTAKNGIFSQLASRQLF